MRFKFYQQLDRMDCGPCCLQMLLKFYTGQKYKITHLRYLCDVGKDGCSLFSIKAAAESFGLLGNGYELNFDDLEDMRCVPCILYWDLNHFVILYSIDKNIFGNKRFLIADPYRGKYVLDEANFKRLWLGEKEKGYLLYIEDYNGQFESISTEFLEVESEDFIARNVKKHKSTYSLILVGLVLSLILQVLFPFLSKSMFDFGIDEKNFSFVLFITISLGLFYLMRLTIQYLRDYSVLKTGTKISIDFVTNFLQRVVKLKYEYFDMKNSGDIIQSITDNTRIENLLTNNLVSFILSSTNLIVFECVLLYFNWKLFLVLNVAIFVYLGWSIFILKKFKNLDYIRFEIASKNQSFVYQLINGILDLKMNNGIHRKIQEWSVLRHGLYEISKKNIVLQQTKKLLGLVIMNFTTLAIVCYSALQVINGLMSVGEFLAIQYIVAQLSLPIDDIIEFKLSYDLAKLSSARFDDTNDFPHENIVDAPPFVEIEDDICFKGVEFSYPGSRHRLILQNINASIKVGKVNAIVGPSGSGKTTFIKILLKLYEPTAGEILINGRSLSEIPHESWRKLTGSVLQDGYIFSEAILHNIILEGGEIDKSRLSEAISAANLDDLINELPKGSETPIGIDGLGLSGGQKQRILIARCIYKNPELLVFDEATNSLDSINEDLIYKNLESYYKGKTVVVIAHRMSTIKNADQILVFNKGTIEEVGNHKELMERGGLYYELCEKQQLLV